MGSKLPFAAVSTKVGDADKVNFRCAFNECLVSKIS
jgi:hypothetical protein